MQSVSTTFRSSRCMKLLDFLPRKISDRIICRFVYKHLHSKRFFERCLPLCIKQTRNVFVINETDSLNDENLIAIFARGKFLFVMG